MISGPAEIRSAARAAFVGAVPPLAAGKVIEARVIAALGDGVFRFTSAENEFDLPLPENLAPGSRVRIAPRPDGGLLVTVLGEGGEAGPPNAAQGAALSQAAVLKEAARAAVTRQDGLGAVFSDAEAVLTQPGVPPAVRQALWTLLSLRLPLDRPPQAADLARAVAQSGLFAEAGLAAGTQAPPPADMKLALLVLRSALNAWLGGANEGAPRIQPVVQPHLPPPGPSAPAAAQLVGVQGSASGAEGVPRILVDTEAALARVSLHQIASVPDEGGPAKADAPEARWSCEIPILVDGRTAIMGFVVERDGRHGAPEDEPRRWRVQAALDLPETGPVHADVRLRGTHVIAGLLAERAAMADVLMAALPQLRDGLTAAGFQVEALSARHGRPEPLPEPPGRYLDERS